MNRQPHASTDADRDDDSPIKSTRGAQNRKAFTKPKDEPAFKRTNTISHKGPSKPLKTSDQKKKEEEAKKPINRPVTGRKSNLKKASTDEVPEEIKSKETSTQIQSKLQQVPIKQRTGTLAVPSTNKFKSGIPAKKNQAARQSV